MSQRILMFLACFSLAFSASSTVIFQDDFEGEISSAYQLNYNSFSNWVVRPNSGNPSVDLIQGGQFGIPNIGTGYFVDMDGSTGEAGRLVSRQLFSFDAGMQYRLSYDLAGNNRNAATDWVRAVATMSSGNVGSTHRIAGGDGFNTFSFTFMGDGSLGRLVFRADFPNALTNGRYPNQNDNVGLLLDNIVLESIPVYEPSTFGLLALGLFGLIFTRRMR